jgi:NAD+ synthetase
LVGLSGGIDSALTAVLAVHALGARNVMGVAMPSCHSADISKQDAQLLAEKLGIEFLTLPIEEVRGAFTATLSETFNGLETDVTEENLQARIRGTLLMALSNKFNRLLLTTGNKSEVSVGYCTLYGDMCGGLAVLSDVPKMLVFELSRWINRDEAIIPWRTIERPPSAELRDDQADTDSLPEYDVLDDILHQAINERHSPAEIISTGHDEKVVADVLRRLWMNEYKRKQMPPGLRVTSKAFGVGRRMPITGHANVVVRPPSEGSSEHA